MVPFAKCCTNAAGCCTWYSVPSVAFLNADTIIAEMIRITGFYKTKY